MSLLSVALDRTPLFGEANLLGQQCIRQCSTEFCGI
jgi:hypothetical protein